jgi:hypothetical protein
MADTNILKRVLPRLVPDLTQPFSRFPLAVLVLLGMVVLAFSSLLPIQPFGDRHATLTPDARMLQTRGDTILAGFFWSIAATLLAERRQKSRLFGAGLGVVGVVALLALAKATTLLSPWVGFEPDVVIAATIMLILALIGGTGAPHKANARILRSLATGVIAYGIAYTVVAIFESGWSLPPHGQNRWWFATERLHPTGKVFLIGLWGFIWLMLLPRHQPFAGPGNADTPPKDSLTATVGDRLLIPLILLAVAVYAGLFGTEGIRHLNMPGHTWRYDAPLELGIGLLALAMIPFLIVYPVRTLTGGFTAGLLRRWWLVAAIPAAFMAAGLILIANPFVDSRIRFHGSPAMEYSRAIWGAGLLAATLIAWLRPHWRDLRLLCTTLAALLFVTSVGPWGQRGFSIWYHRNEFRLALIEAGVLRENLTGGRKVAADARCIFPGSNPPGAHGLCWAIVNGSLDRLRGKHALGVVAPFLADDPESPYRPDRFLRSDNSIAAMVAIERRLGTDLSLPPHRPTTPPAPPIPTASQLPGRPFVFRDPTQHAGVDVTGFDAIVRMVQIGPLQREAADRPLVSATKNRHDVGGGTLWTSVEADAFVIRDDVSGREARIPIADLIAERPAPRSFDAASLDGTLRIRLLLINLSGQREQTGEQSIRSLQASGALLLKGIMPRPTAPK